jgi:hypothetical protein
MFNILEKSNTIPWFKLGSRTCVQMPSLRTKIWSQRCQQLCSWGIEEMAFAGRLCWAVLEHKNRITLEGIETDIEVTEEARAIAKETTERRRLARKIRAEKNAARMITDIADRAPLTCPSPPSCELPAALQGCGGRRQRQHQRQGRIV